MIMLPIPAFAGVILIWLAIRAMLADRRLLALFLGACALQSLVVALVAGWGVDALRPIAPVTAALIPPLAWITLRVGMMGAVCGRAMLPHLAGPVAVLVCRLVLPVALDAVIPLLFAGYGGAILWRLRGAVDLPQARISAGEWPARIWRGLGWALIASGVSDVLIGLAYGVGRPDLAELVISLGSSLSILVIGALSALPEASGGDAPEPAPAPVVADADDVDIVARLDEVLTRDRVHLDPNLTLARLARRLRLPDKRLSAAVNRVSGGNVSRYINGWRVRHACDLLDQGRSVTDAMLDSGFNTKSNFNREFLRVAGMPPGQWRARV
ncbi:helix-turn-helix domain-containing protein [Paracoccus sp. (in: a-proteobacteria)]|uniref:helix-turn-helix domain-containing protein n=1 Tax=Paracoccus sp. TaxID=267 RepID=UPI0026DFB80D|nr:helix-turn-helix domain-containing protein [Paracoccus sp. (in: a-proteobacteria)]MDO5648086.1 helix-turn-helix domain-containing protein [Paracoccus sp. (in: a-proteobacteria)]